MYSRTEKPAKDWSTIDAKRMTPNARKAPSPLRVGRGPRIGGANPGPTPPPSQGLLSNPPRPPPPIQERGQLPPPHLRTYKPGWSVPKLRMEAFDGVTGTVAVGAGVGKRGSNSSSTTTPTRAGSGGKTPLFIKPPLTVPSPLTLAKPPKPTKPTPTKPKKSMLTKFDEAVASPNTKLADLKSTRIRHQVNMDAAKKLDLATGGSVSGAGKQMEKMRNDFLGEITSELGFSYEQNSIQSKAKAGQGPHQSHPQPPKLSAVKLAPAVTDSWSGMSSRLDKAVKDWSTDAQKIENRGWLRGSSGTGSESLLQAKGSRELKASPRKKKNRNKPTLKEYLEMGTGKSARKVGASEAKLGSISATFSASLQPMVDRDVRERLRTPPDNIMVHLSAQHDHAVERLPPKAKGHIKEMQMPKYQPFESGRMKVPEGGSRDRDRPSAKKVKEISKQSSDVGVGLGKSGGRATMPQKLGGLMDFRSLLETQAESERESPPPHEPRHQKRSKEPKFYEPSPISQREIHGTLQRSVKSIDQAARMAQNLGHLMSKVALQNSPASSGRSEDGGKTGTSATTATKSGGPGNDAISIDPDLQHLLKLQRNRTLPLSSTSEDIKKKADHLSSVVEKAERNLKMHGAAFGLDTETETSQKIGPQKGKKSMSTTQSGTQSETNVGIQTGESSLKKKEKKGGNPPPPPQNFEFVPDMSYTDQLMLKKLRGLKASWGGK